MPRKYKVKRPDPAEILKRMRDVAAVMHSHEIMKDQIAAEIQSLLDEANALVARHRERITEMDGQHKAAKVAYDKAREEYMKALFESMQALIEDIVP